MHSQCQTQSSTLINQLGASKPELLVFTDQHGHTIGDVELTGVGGDQTQTPQNAIKVGDAVAVPTDVQTVQGIDLNINPNHEASKMEEYPEMEQGPAQQPLAQPEDIVIEPTLILDITLVNEPPVPAVTLETMPTFTPADVPAQQIPGVCRSMQVRQPVKSYQPSMMGSCYQYATVQLKSQGGTLHPDAHVMFNQGLIEQEEVDIVAMIMTQLSMKAGLKKWGMEGCKVVHAEMKQLHFWDTFLPKHWRDLMHAEKQTILESHLFLKEKRDGSLKG